MTSAPVRAGSPELEALVLEIGAGALERERRAERPFAAIDRVRAAGLGALRVPAADGGGGATLRELFATVIRLASADVNVAHILRGHFAHVEERLRLPGAERARVVDLATRGLIVGNATTELGTTTIGQFRWATTLAPDGDGYRLDGRKYFTTGTLYADLTEVTAGLPDGSTALAVIPTDRAGVTVVDDWDGMGQRLTGTGTATFAGVRVAREEVLVLPGTEGGASGPPMYLSGAFFQLYITALVAGVLHAVRDDAVAHIHGRSRSFDWAPAQPASHDPLLQRDVGELASAAFAAECVVLAAADVLAAAFEADVAGTDPDLALAHEASYRAAQAKVVVDRLGPQAASQLFDVGGASIVREQHLLDRHWRNARTLVSHNPTSYKAQAIGARLLTGAALPGTGYF